MGPRPQRFYVLGRKDARKPFTLANARWQRRNGGNGQRITHAGKSLTLKQWSEWIGISIQRLYQRIEKCNRYGADVSEALSAQPCQTMACTTDRVGRRQGK
jgi:hypothetical protein